MKSKTSIKIPKSWFANKFSYSCFNNIIVSLKNLCCIIIPKLRPVYQSIMYIHVIAQQKSDRSFKKIHELFLINKTLYYKEVINRNKTRKTRFLVKISTTWIEEILNFPKILPSFRFLWCIDFRYTEFNNKKKQKIKSKFKSHRQYIRLSKWRNQHLIEDKGVRYQMENCTIFFGESIFMHSSSRHRKTEKSLFFFFYSTKEVMRLFPFTIVSSQYWKYFNSW